MKLAKNLATMNQIPFVEWHIDESFIGLAVVRPGECRLFHEGDYPAAPAIKSAEALVRRHHDALRGWLDLLGRELSLAYDRLYLVAAAAGGPGGHPWAQAPLRGNSSPTIADADQISLMTVLRAETLGHPLVLTWVIGEHFERLVVDVGIGRQRNALHVVGVGWRDSVDHPESGIECHGKARLWLKERLIEWHLAFAKECTALSADLAWKLMAIAGYPMSERLDEVA